MPKVNDSDVNKGSFDLAVQYHDEDGCWWAESVDMPGWIAAADSREELTALVTEAIPFFAGTPKRWYWFKFDAL